MNFNINETSLSYYKPTSTEVHTSVRWRLTETRKENAYSKQSLGRLNLELPITVGVSFSQFTHTLLLVWTLKWLRPIAISAQNRDLRQEGIPMQEVSPGRCLCRRSNHHASQFHATIYQALKSFLLLLQMS